ATKQALAELSPWTVLFCRTVLGTLFIGGLTAARRGLAPPPAAEWPMLGLLAATGLVLTQGLQAFALGLSTSAPPAWLVALNPVVTALLAALVVGEAVGRRAPGIALAFAGALLVASHGTSLGAALRLPSTRGDALTVLSTLSWSIYSIAGRSFSAR